MDQLFRDERVANDPWMEEYRLAEDGELSQEHSSTSKVSRTNSAMETWAIGKGCVIKIRERWEKNEDKMTN